MFTVHCFSLNPLSYLLQQAHSSNKVIGGAAPNLVPNDLEFNFFHIIKFIIYENLLLMTIQFTGQEKKNFLHTSFWFHCRIFMTESWIDGFGHFVTWSILLIMWQNVSIDCGELVTSVSVQCCPNPSPDKGSAMVSKVCV